MIKKLDRDYCVIKYRKLPLSCYNEEEECYEHYVPKFTATYWLTVENPKQNGAKLLLQEVDNLLAKLEIEALIFMDELNKPWISEETAKRKDFKSIVKMLIFFKSHKIWKKFCGGVLVTSESRKEFLKHFFEITCCDGGFFDFNFTDKKQNYLFYLHYSGELRVMPLNDKARNRFLQVKHSTKFQDAGYPNSERF